MREENNGREITLAHGSGGRAMQSLIEELMLPAFANPALNAREDQARISLDELATSGDRLAVSTDSYVIDPIFFPGGDIGKLAVCGTANDVAVSGAQPRYLSCAMILEEGLPYATLERIVQSMASTAQQAGIQIVTGDTKVVPVARQTKSLLILPVWEPSRLASIGGLRTSALGTALLSAAPWAIMAQPS